MIVTGDIKAIRPVTANKNVGLEPLVRGSEDVLEGEERKEVDVQVRTVEKNTTGGGIPGGGPITITIPSVRDCLNEQPPETIVINMPGIWLLHKNQIVTNRAPASSPSTEFASALPQSYRTLTPSDFQSEDPENLARVRRMIQEIK